MSSLNVHVCEQLEPIYKIGKSLGFAGSFGKAYDIEDLSNNKVLLAVKSIVKKNVDDRLCRNEIEMCKLINKSPHPNVLWFDRIVNTPTHLYIIMERCTGGDLFDFITTLNNKLHLNLIRDIFKQLLGAMGHLHTKVGIIHGDLKLCNILLCDKSDNVQVKVIDFGLSKKLEPGNYVSGNSGTPAFQAPEQIRGHYNEKADMFALGVILFIMLYKFNPFDPFARSSKSRIKRRILTGFNPTVQLGHGAFFPSHLESPLEARDLITRLLHPNPDIRPTASQALKHQWFKN